MANATKVGTSGFLEETTISAGGESVNIEALSADKTLTASDAPIQIYTCTANRTITLPTTGLTVGQKFVFWNNSAYGSSYYFTISGFENIYAQSIREYRWSGSVWIPQSKESTSIGYNASAFEYGVAIGYNANGYNGVAIGSGSIGYAFGQGVGIGADGSNSGVAIGRYSNANPNGIALGNNSNGQTYGSAIGHVATVNSQGRQTVCIGAYSKAQRNREIVSVSHDSTTPLSMLTIQKYKYKDITTAAWNEMYVDASSARLSILAKSAYTFRAQIVAFDYTNYKAKSWEITGLIRRDNSNNTVLIASTVSVIAADTEAATWDARITADDTNEALKLEVYGEAGKTIRFTANIFATEVRN